ncbi:metal-dependent hydrolase family protein [Microtetraspora fusca]|uniref:metal-dependent hydrolase family protein n=1 Tax=Microtetraspora fusca TaxID=1997 RepID=UPI000833D06E|nr:amidohydrolase family protein [Microtetraspora fusca]
MTRTLFHGGRVFDGTGTPIAQADVVVEDGRIVEVGTGLDGDVGVDASGLTLLPGLFDCHVHVTGSGLDLPTRLEQPFSYQFYAAMANLAATLDCGITTARDAEGADLGVQLALERGLIQGPRLQISISMISQTGGHGDGWRASGNHFLYGLPYPGRPDGIADGPDEVRRKVRELLRAGAEVIKVCTTGGVLSPRDDPRHRQFSPEELAVIVDEAAAQGRAVMAHATSPAGVKNAVRAGARSIEHGTILDDESIEMMVKAGTWLVPTLSAGHSLLAMADQGMRISPNALAKAREMTGVHRESVARAYAAGVKIAMGTDSGVTPHGENLLELRLMQEAGMKPEDVLAAATSSAADLLGVADDRGTIAPGKRADLVLVDRDPYDLADLKSAIVAVYQDGVRVRG